MSETENHIAIIGMACRLPGANDTKTYWQNLRDGVESILFFSQEKARSSGVDAEILNSPNFVRAGGVIDQVEEFDPALFNLSLREALLTDPQHRLLLECGWEALEKAGYNPRSYDGMIGVFVGSGPSSYLIDNIIPSHLWQDLDSRYEVQFENFFGYLSQKISYNLQLKGPSVTIQASCSTSLVTTHLACQSLLNYECDMALSGGVSVLLPQHRGYLFQPENILSPDGHCRAFDSNAAGTVGSNGAGLVVLKRLQDAIQDGDCIDAVIIGSAVNNDGGRKQGFTAPSAQAQAEVVAMAQAMADVEPDDIRFIETHGTGTLLGDPIEISGLKKAFNSDKVNHCALGSVKCNIGHTDAASGIAGLIKTALVVKNGIIPPNINYVSPNPALQIEKSPFFINDKCIDWPDDRGCRIGGVSSFGMGGSNAHIILQQPPDLKPRQTKKGPSLVVLSAASEKSLQQSGLNLERFLQSSKQESVKDIAYTLQVGRVPLSYRRAMVCQGKDDLLAKLTGEVNHDFVAGKVSDSAKPVTFMFTGQGSQYVNMGRDLYGKVEVFRSVFDQCAALLKPHLNQDICALLYVTSENEKEATQQIGQTRITQPLLFAFEYALAKMWQAWGIKPASFIGHSIGEYVAACLAGVMSLEDALLIVSERGRLIQSLPGGTMLSVSLTEEKVTPWLGDGVALAAINAPASCVLSGETPAIDKLANELEKQGIGCRKLHTSHAFHSSMMDPILDTFRKRLESIKLLKPRTPFISNVTGKWITDEEATSPDYWVRHIRQAVRFSEGIQCLTNTSENFLLELGPGNTLSSLSRKQNQIQESNIFTSVRHPLDQVADDTFIYKTLSKLWVAGCDVKWASLPDAENCRRISLPTYPFDKKRCWVEPGLQTNKTQPQQVEGKYADIEKWFYQPSWKRTPLVQSRDLTSKSKRTWVIIAYPGPVAEALKEELAKHGDTVVSVFAGTEFKQEENQFTIDPTQNEHYENLLTKIYSKESQLQFVQALNLTSPPVQKNDKGLIDSCMGLLNLVQVINAQEDRVSEEMDVVLNVLTQGAEDVLGDEASNPDSSLLAGMALVCGQETPNCFTRHFDLAIEEVSQADSSGIKNLTHDLHSNIDARSIAYRNRQRWQPEFQDLNLNISKPTDLRPQGVYLITGGLGKVGLTIAQYLAEKVSARLILVSRSKLPPKDEWDAIIQQPEGTILAQRLQMIRNIEKAGAVVHTKNADVSSVDDMTELMEYIGKEFGALNGVIHSAGFMEMDAQKFSQEIKDQDLENHFRPKVEGVKVLERVLGNRDLDFCMLVSSLSAQLGGLGYGVYSSANRFMDAFAKKMHSKGFPWLSVEWDSWQFESPLSANKEQARLAPTTYYLVPNEGMLVLDKVFSIGNALPVLCVSTGDLPLRYKQAVLQVQETSQQDQSGSETQLQDQSETKAKPGGSPRNETEKVLVEIWQVLLGVDHVGIKDNFFELGGNSLIGLRLTSRIRKQLNVKLSINDLLKAPTIIELASNLLEQDQKPGNDSDEANKLRDKIDQMSPEQVKALLEKKQRERSTQ